MLFIVYFFFHICFMFFGFKMTMPIHETNNRTTFTMKFYMFIFLSFCLDILIYNISLCFLHVSFCSFPLFHLFFQHNALFLYSSILSLFLAYLSFLSFSRYSLLSSNHSSKVLPWILLFNTGFNSLIVSPSFLNSSSLL